MDYSKYPPNWKQISANIRFDRAGNRCEGSPFYPDCRAENGKPHPVTNSKVVLTVAHLNHNTNDNRPENLRALCQRCHLTHDSKYHALNARLTKTRRFIDAGQSHFYFYNKKTQLVAHRTSIPSIPLISSDDVIVHNSYNRSSTDTKKVTIQAEISEGQLKFL